MARNENMPEGLKDRTECGRIWSIGRCCFGRDWNKKKRLVYCHMKHGRANNDQEVKYGVKSR